MEFFILDKHKKYNCHFQQEDNWARILTNQYPQKL